MRRVGGRGETRVLLQIFSKTVIWPDFSSKFIQRKGIDGFARGNFRALFESIEEDSGSSWVVAAAPGGMIWTYLSTGPRPGTCVRAARRRGM